MANKMLQSLKFPGLSDDYLIPLMQDFAPVYDSTATYAVGDYCTHDNKFYVCTTAISTAEAWTVGHWTQVSVADIATAIGADVDDLKEALNSKAPITGLSADLVAGSAEQLLSDVGTEDEAPYLFRATPYDSTRVDEEIVGVSVGWNQLAKYIDTETRIINGLTVTINSGVITINGTASARTVIGGTEFASISGHKVLLLGCPSGGSTSTYNLIDGYNGLFPDTGSGKVGVIGASQVKSVPQIIINPGTEINNLTFKPQYFDLTAWFGSTIADYAYTLEQATAGSGVAWIKQYLPGGYIPYSAPTLKSIEGLAAHVTRGFNQWDEEWEVGGLSNGSNYAYNDRIRSKNRCPIIPGATYYLGKATAFSGNFWISYYDADGTYIPGNNASGYTTLSRNATFNVPANAHYFRFQITSTTTYANDICINLSDPAKNGTYEPYEAHTYALDSDLTLRGILKMDSDHNVYADGDVYGADGTVTRYYDEVDLGTLNWSAASAYGNTYRAGASLNRSRMDSPSTGQYAPAMCSQVEFAHSLHVADSAENARANTYGLRYDSIYVLFDTEKTATEVKNALNGVKLLYGLRASAITTETADPYTSPQNCEPGGTEEYVYADGGSGIPVGHNSKYLANLKGELERVMVAVPDAPSANGTYSLKATVSSGVVTYAWVSD